MKRSLRYLCATSTAYSPRSSNVALQSPVGGRGRTVLGPGTDSRSRIGLGRAARQGMTLHATCSGNWQLNCSHNHGQLQRCANRPAGRCCELSCPSMCDFFVGLTLCDSVSRVGQGLSVITHPDVQQAAAGPRSQDLHGDPSNAMSIFPQQVSNGTNRALRSGADVPSCLDYSSVVNALCVQANAASRK